MFKLITSFYLIPHPTPSLKSKEYGWMEEINTGRNLLPKVYANLLERVWLGSCNESYFFHPPPRKLTLIRQRPISRPVQDPPSAAASTAEKTPMVIRHRMLWCLKGRQVLSLHFPSKLIFRAISAKILSIK